MTKKKSNLSRNILLLIGPAIFFALYFLLPESIFTTSAARGAVATVAWMAFWWVTGPIDYAITGFLPIGVNALFQLVDMKSVISNYASETIMLLLGASILVASWEVTGLDRRIAAKFLSLVGGNLKVQIVFWFLISAVLSAVLPNAVVCATITPIAVSMLKFIGEDDISKSKNGSLILVTIVYAAGMGGLATPLGGAMNLITVQYIQDLTGKEYMYTDWLIRFLPVVLVLLISNIVYLLVFCKRGQNLAGSKKYFSSVYKELPPMSMEEGASLVLFLVATLLSFTRQFYQDILPGLKPAYVFIICAIFSFVITRKDGSRLMIWKTTQGKIGWDLIFIFAGGLAAGTLINDSGAAQNLGDFIAQTNFNNEFLLILAIVALTLIMSDITSNTATAAVTIPIVISIVQGMGKDPIPYVFIASIGVNLSYMLPTSIRAIPVGYGLSPKYMLKKGAPLTVIVIALMTLVSWAMLELGMWPTMEALA